MMLLDSGSSHSFLNVDLVDRLGLKPDSFSTVKVQVANEEVLYCSGQIPLLSWWMQGRTFCHDMKVTGLGGYDAVLGIDWLEQYSPMKCQWANKWVEFKYKNNSIKLQGVEGKEPTTLQESSMEQIIKWHKGNDVWATTIVENCQEHNTEQLPPQISRVLQ